MNLNDIINKFIRRDKKEVNSKKNLIEDERENYYTLCSRFFFNKIKRGPGIVVSNNDSELSEIDKKVFPHIAAGALFGEVPCDESCPGYTPIPVKPFRMPGADIVRCQRYIPKYMLDKGWDGLRNRAMDYFKESGESYE